MNENENTQQTAGMSEVESLRKEVESLEEALNGANAKYTTYRDLYYAENNKTNEMKKDFESLRAVFDAFANKWKA